MTSMISEEKRNPAIVILDFGSQYSELIARRIRETEVYSLVMSYTTSADQLRSLDPKGIISVSYTHLTLPTKRIV